MVAKARHEGATANSGTSAVLVRTGALEQGIGFSAFRQTTAQPADTPGGRAVVGKNLLRSRRKRPAG